MNKLATLINELELKVPKQQGANHTVSKASVGWHIEHTLLVIDTIIENLQKSDPANYRWRFNLIRTLVYTLNKIPRGKVRSPKSVVPTNNFNTETLKVHVDTTKNKIKTLESLPRNSYFEHPFFGKLNLKSATRFLELHTNHHLHIIYDIIKTK